MSDEKYIWKPLIDGERVASTNVNDRRGPERALERRDDVAYHSVLSAYLETEGIIPPVRKEN